MRRRIGVAGGAVVGLGVCLLGLGELGLGTSAQAAYPGRNGYVAWTHYGNGDARDIFRQFRDGSGTGQLTRDGDSSDPNWSPDGRRIAYVTGGRIAVMRADGSDRHLLGVSGSSPTWAPDGARIAYISGGDVRRVGASGGPSTLLLSHSGRTVYRDASYSPVDADRILLNHRLVLHISTGSTLPLPVRKVAPNDVISSVNWRPDGRSVVFLATCTAGGHCTSDRRNIYVQTLSGGSRQALTARRDCDTDVDCVQFLTVTSAPDGNDVLVSEDENNGGGSLCVYAVNARMNTCSGPADYVEPGDWQSLH